MIYYWRSIIFGTPKQWKLGRFCKTWLVWPIHKRWYLFKPNCTEFLIKYIEDKHLIHKAKKKKQKTSQHRYTLRFRKVQSIPKNWFAFRFAFSLQKKHSRIPFDFVHVIFRKMKNQRVWRQTSKQCRVATLHLSTKTRAKHLKIIARTERFAIFRCSPAHKH